MEDNNNQEVKKEIEKKKGIKVYHIIIILLVVIIALLGVHIYADNAGYGNIIGLVKENVFLICGMENIMY